MKTLPNLTTHWDTYKGIYWILWINKEMDRHYEKSDLLHHSVALLQKL